MSKGRSYYTFLALLLPLFFLIPNCSRKRAGVINRASDGSLTTTADSSSTISSGSSSFADKRLDAMESKVDKASHHVGKLVTAMAEYKDTMENSRNFTKEYHEALDKLEKRIAGLEAHKGKVKQEIEKLDLSSDQFASRERLNHLEEYITVINKKLSKILKMGSPDKLLETLSKSEAEAQASQRKIEDLSVHLNRLRQEAGQIRQETGQIGSRIGVIAGKIDQLSNQTRQLYELIKQGDISLEKLKKEQQELLAAQKKLKTTQKKLIKKVNKKEDETREISEKALYDSANRLHVNQAYTDSIVLFSRFVDTFPKSKLADNAQYWVGMGYFSLENYSRAADEFEQVWQKKFSDDSAAVNALFKLGECFLKLNERDRAASSFRRVLKEGSGNQKYFLLVDGARKYLSEMGEAP